MKFVTQWKSERVREEVTLARWGEIGRPVLLFPTAGGDAEVVEADPVAAAVAEDVARPKEPFKRPGRKIGRNEPCPCGSGKKYKQCHGRLS